MNIYQKLGLTPIYVRLAANYMALGTGEYPCERFNYDKVRVSVDRQWNNYAHEDDPDAYFMTTKVEFFRYGQRQKWVEFKTQMVGGGSREPGFQVHNAKETQ